MEATHPMVSVTGIAGLLWALFAGVGAVVGYIIFLVAVWRAMKAHERIAETLRDIAIGLGSER